MISSKIAILIVFEVVWSLAIVWMFFHEEKLVDFENAVFRAIKKKIEKKKIDICAKWLAKNNLVVVEKKER